MRATMRAEAPTMLSKRWPAGATRRSSATEPTDVVMHDFGSVRISALPGPAISAAVRNDIPVAGETGEEIVDQPPGTTSAAPAATPTDSCDQPISMEKLTSGQFLGGLTMDGYYPDLAGKGYYDHPATAGTFDTGSRVGGNVQLCGVIPSPCSPPTFSLAQTVRRTRFRINGVITLRKARRSTTSPRADGTRPGRRSGRSSLAAAARRRDTSFLWPILRPPGTTRPAPLSMTVTS